MELDEWNLCILARLGTDSAHFPETGVLVGKFEKNP